MSRAMYAVIRTGGKQYKVEAGEQLEVERLGLDDGSELELAPVLVVDGETVQATPAQLDGAVVKARVVGATRGPKIKGFTYKNKSNQRRHWGHRQHYSLIEITAISTSK
jgi:large subunit ribosomal protein L21